VLWRYFTNHAFSSHSSGEQSILETLFLRKVQLDLLPHFDGQALAGVVGEMAIFHTSDVGSFHPQ
jgi:hypothetical protein